MYTSSRKVPVILVRLQSNLNFLEIFWKNNQVSNFKRIRPVGELCHVDRRTGRQDEANSRFSHFFFLKRLKKTSNSLIVLRDMTFGAGSIAKPAAWKLCISNSVLQPKCDETAVYRHNTSVTKRTKKMF